MSQSKEALKTYQTKPKCDRNQSGILSAVTSGRTDGRTNLRVIISSFWCRGCRIVLNWKFCSQLVWTLPTQVTSAVLEKWLIIVI